MRRFAALFLLCLGLAGCSHSPHVPGVLHLAQSTDASTLDPARAYDTTSMQYVRLMYRGLVDYDENANIINELATKREASPDGLTYTFWLRKGVKYHDGSEVKAADCRYVIERDLDPSTASDALKLYDMIDGAKEWREDRAGPKKLQHIRGIEVVNDYKIIYHLCRADATFLNYMALPFAYPVSQAWVEKVGTKALSENPNGCGPFKMKEWVHDGWLTLVKNPDYYKPDIPKVNRIEVRFGISPSLQIMLFEQGAIDIQGISDAYPPDFLRLTTTEPYKSHIVHRPMMDIRYLAMNNELKPFTDARVRQAFNYAINRNRIAGFLTGRATRAEGPLPAGMPAYNPQLKGYGFDRDKARQLLKAAGYKDDPNAPLVLDYPTNEQWYGKAAQAIQEDMRVVGVSISLQAMAYGELKTKAGTRKKSQMSLLGWLQDFPDPSNFLDVLFNEKSISDTASVNRAFYSNPKVTKLLDAAGVEPNRAKRLAMYTEIEKMVVADAPWDFLFHTERYVVTQPWVKGFKLSPAWSAVYENVSVD